MAVVLKVKWVDQTDQPEPHERIRRIGGGTRDIEWTHTQTDAIQFIEHGIFAYFIEKDALALELKIGRTEDGSKYLTIRDDDRQILLGLPGSSNPATARL